PSVFILLKSNYGLSRLRPGNPELFPISADSLFVPFYFLMSFQSSRFAPHYTPRQPPPASHSPIFRLFFTQNPKPDPLPRLFPFSLFPFILSTTAAPPARKKSLIITKHFLDFKNIYGIIPLE
ncbi:MAG TPA: hypothetical protein PLB76_11605, partial [Anaerohalosphaeraceae bacterium]|nr:hypothetical protein [Anaerohalosphaeraceae bacterium]